MFVYDIQWNKTKLPTMLFVQGWIIDPYGEFSWTWPEVLQFSHWSNLILHM